MLDRLGKLINIRQNCKNKLNPENKEFPNLVYKARFFVSKHGITGSIPNEYTVKQPSFIFSPQIP